MLRCVRHTSYNSNFFTKTPLNAELYIKRLQQVQIQHLPPSKAVDLIIDCITANRRLQTEKLNNQTDEFGILPQVSNTQLDAQLHQFLQHHSSFVAHYPDIIRRYMTMKPVPHNASYIMDLVQQQFQFDNSNVKGSNSNNGKSLDILRLGIDTLLKSNDYANCFKLLEETVCSEKYIHQQRQMLKKKVKYWGSGFIGLNGLQMILLPLVPVPIILGVNSVFYWLLMKWFLNLKYPNHLGRLSWRDSTRLHEIIVRSPELFMVSRMMTFFEEHNEVNLMNFHHSQVRQFSTLNVNKWRDYSIETPTSTEIVKRDNRFQDEHVLAIRQLFKEEIQRRKMVIHDLPQELQFVEFWLTQGENFEWVEPDQDPAEMDKYRPQSKGTTM